MGGGQGQGKPGQESAFSSISGDSDAGGSETRWEHLATSGQSLAGVGGVKCCGVWPGTTSEAEHRDGYFSDSG